MQLCEEYLRRHSLDFPFVRYNKRGCLFLSNPSPTVRWAIVYINWCRGSSHPGTYQIRLLRPIHNGYVENEFFEPFLDGRGNPVLDWEGHWDEYQDYILLLASCLSGRPIVCRQEVALSAWEMFLMSHDGWLSSHIHADRIFPIIDSDLRIDERHAHLTNTLKHLALEHEEVYKYWSKKVAALTSSYSYWLGEIMTRKSNVEEEANSSKKSKFRELLGQVMS